MIQSKLYKMPSEKYQSIGTPLSKSKRKAIWKTTSSSNK
jgi:hypothetical protein